MIVAAVSPVGPLVVFGGVHAPSEADAIPNAIQYWIGERGWDYSGCALAQRAALRAFDCSSVNRRTPSNPCLVLSVGSNPVNIGYSNLAGFVDLGAVGGGGSAVTIEVDLGGGVLLRVRRG